MACVQEDNSMEEVANVVEEKVVEEKPEKPAPAAKPAVESDIKKINIGDAVNIPLALAARGVRLGSDQFEKMQVAEKLTSVTQHPSVVKVWDKVSVSKEFMYVALGLVLLFHGAQFKNLFLCAQVVVYFCGDRLKEGVKSIKNDVFTAWDKMVADAPSPDAKAEPKPDNKAAKRNSKKDSGKADAVDFKQQAAEHAAVTKKALKALDSDKVARSAFDVFASFMACHMVMHFGSMQVVTITHALVQAAKKRIDSIFDFVGLEDLVAWTNLMVSFALYVVFGFIAVFMGPLALAMNLGVVGAHLIVEHGPYLAQAMGKLESAEAYAGSMKALAALGGLTAFGTFWQLWALAAGSGLGWIMTLVYMPAVVAETFVGVL